MKTELLDKKDKKKSVFVFWEDNFWKKENRGILAEKE
jgi:hypothetical protein